MQTITGPKAFSLSKLFVSIRKGFVKAASDTDLQINDMKSIKIKGKEILLCRSENGYHALQAKCSYGRYELAEGIMISNTIQCLKHGCQFSAQSGIVKKGPAAKALKTYKTLHEGGYIYIEV